MLAELSAKRLPLLKEAVPRVARVAVLWTPDTPWHPKAVEDLKKVAPSLSIELIFAKALGLTIPESILLQADEVMQ
jgi:ABC-type uncharacterized transport system substrate-binding protein